MAIRNNECSDINMPTGIIKITAGFFLCFFSDGFQNLILVAPVVNDAEHHDILFLLMEEAFYAGQKKPEEAVVISPASQIESRQNEETTTNPAEEANADAALLMRLLQKPEMTQLLKTLAQNL